MSNFIVGQLKPRTDEEYQAAIDEMLAEVQQSQAPIDRHQERTERLKAETQKRGNAETRKRRNSKWRPILSTRRRKSISVRSQSGYVLMWDKIWAHITHPTQSKPRSVWLAFRTPG